MKSIKRILVGLLICVALIQVTSCTDYPPNGYYGTQDYPVIQGPNGVQQVIIRDNSGQQFLMDYLIFNSLMNSGGYNNVLSTYNRNRSYYPIYTTSRYSNYRTLRTIPRTTFAKSYRSPSSSYSSPKSYSTPSVASRLSSSSSSLRSTSTYKSPSTSSLRSSSSPRSSGSSLRSSSRSSSRRR